MAALFVNRFSFKETETLSRVYLVEDDGSVSFEGFAVEDKVRAPGVKVQDETAIPAGSYKMRISKSPKFGRLLPEILDVPGFSGIRIHKGNTAADSSGCLIIGRRLGPKLPVELSAIAEKKLLAAINGREMKIFISGTK
jgi:hypothetical protein